MFASTQDTVRLYYNIAEYELSAGNQRKLDSLCKAFKNVDNLRITGFADYLGTGPDNVLLSQKRAETVAAYIKSHINLVMTANWEGAEMSTVKKGPSGDPFNRRVDIVINKVDHSKMVNQPQLPAPQFTDKIATLTNIEVGGSLALEELTFQSARHFLNPECEANLKILLSYLKQHDNIRFEIQGHICCDNGPDGMDIDSRDYKLSVNRAKFIYDYFIKNGLNAKRMTYKGLASTKPKVFPERTDHDKYLNRRVELLITGK
ncbi:MAG: OmpA family protein [Mucilaginibacter sp.]